MTTRSLRHTEVGAASLKAISIEAQFMFPIACRGQFDSVDIECTGAMSVSGDEAVDILKIVPAVVDKRGLSPRGRAVSHVDHLFARN